MAFRGSSAYLLTPSFFNHFGIGLNAPEAGPMVPVFVTGKPEFVSVPMGQNPDAFRMIAEAVIDQADAVKKAGRMVESRMSPLEAMFRGAAPGAILEEKVNGLPLMTTAPLRPCRRRGRSASR